MGRPPAPRSPEADRLGNLISSALRILSGALKVPSPPNGPIPAGTESGSCGAWRAVPVAKAEFS